MTLRLGSLDRVRSCGADSSVSQTGRGWSPITEQILPKNPSERTAAPLFRPVAALAAAALLFSGSVCTPAAESLSDPQFARGFDVHDPAPGKHVPRGAIQPRSGAGEPEWVLAQWSCRSSLHQAAAESLPDGSVCFADAGKAVTFGPVSGAGHSLTFALNGIGEYGGRLRQPDEPWIHLLAEQPIASHPPFLELAELRFRMRCRLLRAESGLAQDQIKPWHAARFLAYLTIRTRIGTARITGTFSGSACPSTTTAIECRRIMPRWMPARAIHLQPAETGLHEPKRA